MLAVLLTVASAAYGSLVPRLDGYNSSIFPVCDRISSSISSESSVYYPGTVAYAKDIYHWSISSTQPSTCTVEPASVQDVANVLQIVGQTRTPFGIKSGGHTSNPGFSSSPGVLIAMYRFNKVEYDPLSQTATIGTGLTFDDVYAALAPYHVSVVGARESSVGVGGFVLGGGYSWKTGQYGLALDTVTAFELVKPDGAVVMVTEQSDSELFFGLKGGYNNFGIVTRITMQTFPQTSVWGGSVTYTLASLSDVTAAVVKFSTTNTDPKAGIGGTYGCLFGDPLVGLLLYYDAPSPPQGLFDDFLKIPALNKDIRERSLSDYIRATPANVSSNVRIVSQTVPILQYTAPVMSMIESEKKKWCQQELATTAPFIAYTIEPLLPTVLSHSTSSSAYPPTRDKAFSPFLVYFGWLDESLDNQVINDIKGSAALIRQAVIKDGQDITGAPMYPNYASFDTPLEQMYGDNVSRLKILKSRVDPANVMGLAGGYRF